MNPLKGIRLDGCLPDKNPGEAAELMLDPGLNLPSQVDLRPHCPPVENQGHVGSCVANAVVGALEYQQIRQGLEFRDLSRLFVYYNARRMNGIMTHFDLGTSIQNAMAAVIAYGVCSEESWPYNEKKKNKKPSSAAYSAARKFTGISFARLRYGAPVKAALAQGLPVPFAVTLPEEFYKIGYSTGRIMRPQSDWPSAPMGGHAMLIVGYDDAQGAWLVRNSWGEECGDAGYMWIGYDVMERYYREESFWTIGAVEGRVGLTLRKPGQAYAAPASAAPQPLQSQPYVPPPVYTPPPAAAPAQPQPTSPAGPNIQDIRQQARNRLKGQ